MRQTIIILLITNVILISFSSCHRKKEVKVLGFAYKDDKVTILVAPKNKPLVITANTNQDSNKICSFYEKEKLYIEDNDTKVKIIIYSNNIKVLDTLVIIPKAYKEPFISFIYPSRETQHKRKIFIEDEAGGRILKE